MGGGTAAGGGAAAGVAARGGVQRCAVKHLEVRHGVVLPLGGHGAQVGLVGRLTRPQETNAAGSMLGL